MSELRMEKLSMESVDVTKENIEKIKELFPNVVTEGKIDFDQLKLILGEQIEVRNERYQFTWNGKSDSIRFAQRPSTGTLRPDKESSKNWDTTENLYIEGDNLEVLKLLQKSYHQKIRMIYVDPPYNTGKDRVYEDDYSNSLENYKKLTSQMMRVNPETEGRYHTNWLNHIYPRLLLASNLLHEEGVIFISIDDKELSNLIKICNEIFGEFNFIAKIIHKNNSMKNQTKLIGVSTEYVLVYAKNKSSLSNAAWKIEKKGAKDINKKFQDLKTRGIPLSEIEYEIKEMYSRPKYSHLSRWNKIDLHGVFKDADLSREGGPKDYTITNPNTGKDCVVPKRGWGKSKAELLRLQELDLIWYGDENTPPGQKSYITDESMSVPDNFWYYDNSIDTRWLKQMFGSLVFENPKPIEMIKNLILLHMNDGLVLDFYGGSSTTAHAVMQLNADDGGNRKFIVVQLPEKTDEKSEAYKAGYENICEIGKERIRRAGDKIKGELKEKQKNQGMLEDTFDPEKFDIGFKVFKLDTSNFSAFDSSSKDLDNIFNQDVFVSERSRHDILYEILLKYGVFEKPVDVLNINSKEVFSVAMNQTIVSINNSITEEDIIQIANLKPREVIFDERGFYNDNDKINALKRLETAGVEKVATI